MRLFELVERVSDEIDRAFEGVFKEDYLDKDKVSMSDKKKENLEEDLSSISFDIEHKKEESLLINNTKEAYLPELTSPKLPLPTSHCCTMENTLWPRWFKTMTHLSYLI